MRNRDSLRWVVWTLTRHIKTRGARRWDLRKQHARSFVMMDSSEDAVQFSTDPLKQVANENATTLLLLWCSKVTLELWRMQSPSLVPSVLRLWHVVFRLGSRSAYRTTLGASSLGHPSCFLARPRVRRREPSRFCCIPRPCRFWRQGVLGDPACRPKRGKNRVLDVQ